MWLTGRRPQGRCFQGRGLARACQCSAPKLKRKHPAAGGQVLWIQKVRFGSVPLSAQQTNTATIVCTITIYQIQVNIWKSFGNHLEKCTTNKNSTTNSVQWTLQLLVSDARTECTGSLIRGRPARRGYRFALFSDAQGTPSLRIRVGQRGQGTRTSAARRGSVVAAASITQKHRRLVAR